jgi:hypothetical protein
MLETPGGSGGPDREEDNNAVDKVDKHAKSGLSVEKKRTISQRHFVLTA